MGNYNNSSDNWVMIVFALILLYGCVEEDNKRQTAELKELYQTNNELLKEVIERLKNEK